MGEVVANPFDELPLRNNKYAALCTELHLGGKGITRLKDFDKFITLNTLFLNDNRITSLQGLEENFRIKHLYLHNNLIRTLEPGCFKFAFLYTLTLNGNLLDDLDGTIREIKTLRHLKSLDLFDNPIAQEDNYRKRVICELAPSVEVLDRQRITSEERSEAQQFKVRMAKLMKLSNQQRQIQLPPTEEEEAAMKARAARLEDLLQVIRRKCMDIRPFLEDEWSVYDRRDLGLVREAEFWEILRQHGIEQMLREDEKELVLSEFRRHAAIPALSATGTLSHELVDYRQFVTRAMPKYLQQPPKKWRFEPSQEISTTAKDLSQFVSTVKTRRRVEAETMKRTALLGSGIGSREDDDNIFGGRRAMVHSCEKHGLDPWLAGELEQLIDSTSYSDYLLENQLLEIFDKMLVRKKVPEIGIKAAIDLLLGLSTATDPTGVRQVSLTAVKKSLGCSGSKKKKPTGLTQGSAAPAAAQEKNAKAKAGNAKPSPQAPVQLNSSASTAAAQEDLPQAFIKWRDLAQSELSRMVESSAETAAQLLDKLLRVPAKQDSSELFRQTMVAGIDVSRLRSDESLYSNKTESTFKKPSEIMRSAGTRADIIVLPNLHVSLSRSLNNNSSSAHRSNSSKASREELASSETMAKASLSNQRRIRSAIPPPMTGEIEWGPATGTVVLSETKQLK